MAARGDDVIYGGAGDDAISGGLGNDTIYGNAGNDDLDAGPGTNQTLDGGTGDDTLLFGSYGTGTAVGGEGADSLVVDWTASTHDVVASASGITDGVQTLAVSGIEALDITTGSATTASRARPMTTASIPARATRRFPLAAARIG